MGVIIKIKKHIKEIINPNTNDKIKTIDLGKSRRDKRDEYEDGEVGKNKSAK